jgi:hypothetical protein
MCLVILLASLKKTITCVSIVMTFNYACLVLRDNDTKLSTWDDHIKVPADPLTTNIDILSAYLRH